jgi:hypothetical protein
MRVRISYSVELEHVPSECERMLYDAAGDLQEMVAEVSDLCAMVHKKDVNPAIIGEIFESIRKKLAAVDAAMADSDLIMKGYYGAVHPAKEIQHVEEG